MVQVFVEVDLDEFEDDEIVEEIFYRNLVDAVLARGRGTSQKTSKANAGQALDDIEADLMCKRPRQAENALIKLIDELIGRDLIAALDAIRAGQIGEAICRLESHRRPSPAAGPDAAQKFPKQQSPEAILP